MRPKGMLSAVPNEPAVYALIAGDAPRTYIAYVGIAGKLRQRLAQHLVLRDSSVTTGASAVTLNPEHLTEVIWWLDSRFEKRSALEAAELVAIEVLDPVLRSRGSISADASALAEDATFRAWMKELFQGEPTGQLDLPTMASVLDRLADLERRVAKLEDRKT